MMSCHLIPTWHEWNVKADDVMMMWFASYANQVMSQQAYTTCMCMYGTHALCRNSMSKYLNDLVCMQADLNLEKITSSHFQVLNTQNANENMPNMIPIAYLN